MKTETLRIAVVLALSACLLMSCNSSRYNEGGMHNHRVDNRAYRGY
ncbi:MAG: hypothetical protein ABI683_14150 [Ginsengibacter sp.]